MDELQEFSQQVAPQGKVLINEIEELVMKMSIQAISINRSHGKTLRELFNMFSGKIVKAIDYEGFKEMT